ncbi:MAG: hypothetical protein ABSE15_02510 [Candidatus Bathyarchaeia archaeon]
MGRGRTYIRPVKEELIEFFKQNDTICVTAREATESLRKQGYSHEYRSVQDNLFMLATLGFLIYDKVQRQFSLDPNAAKVDLTRKVFLELPSSRTKPKRPPNGHCDKCHKEFGPDEEIFERPFANIQLFLCSGCL